MKLKYTRAYLLLLLLIFPVFVFSQTLDEKIREIDAYAEKARRDWNIPGMAIAIVKDDKVVFAKGYGVRELGKTDKVDENTLFAIASNSKAFTTAALAILADEGKLSWDDKVIKHLPEFELADPYVTREMTVRDLVSHRSGFDTFSGDLLWYETTYKDDDILKRLRYLKPKTSFRTSYGYQNLMFIVAGKIVERVSGKTWSQFVGERILTPLGMSRTTTSVKDLKDNYSMPHNESGGTLRVLHLGNVDGATAAAGLNSSVADVAKWLRLQLARGKYEGKQIFTEKQSWEMQQQNLAILISQGGAKFIPSRHFYGYGLGWFLWDYHGRKVVSHGGGLDGMISETAMMPEENLGLVVLTNSETPVNVIMQNKIFDVFVNAPKRDWSAEYLERTKAGKTAEAEAQKKLEASRVKNTKPSLSLSDYAGTYTGPLYGDVKIAEENGKLVLRMIPSPNFVADLEHWHYDTFRIKWRPTVAYNFPPGFVTFTIDKNGKPDEIKIDQPNNDFWFYELELKRSK
ncbi:MAG TPA: serine hydrolase [Pyrinomonadaceae bacterium]|jgi:CubicO group peptidase (beta-lactamase class C family)